MKGQKQYSKIFALSVFGIYLFGMIVFVIFTDFFSDKNLSWISLNLEKTNEFVKNGGKFSEKTLLAVSTNSNNPDGTIMAQISLNEGDSNYNQQGNNIDQENTNSPESLGTTVNSDKEFVNTAVYSTINLRYDGRLHRIESSDIQLMVGHSEYLEEAVENFDQFGSAGIRTIVMELFEPFEYDKKVFQPNSQGILKDQIRGFEYYVTDYGPNIDDTVEEVERVVRTRLQLNNGAQDYITVKNVQHEGTNGEYSNEKYIELDHSKQMIYAWENGKLYKKWSSSGFYDEYAVFGVFDIKNKSKKAWSPIAEKWMPYWMAFYYENKQAAWFGLHELVYWYDADGNRIEESSDSIGLKKSGGCVRLDRGKMIELYDWTDVGIHFLIYE